MSNLIKSGFVPFSTQEVLVIDANKSQVIQSIDSQNEERMLSQNTYREKKVLQEESAEEALAAALIRDVGLDEDDYEEDLMENGQNQNMEFSEEETARQSEEILYAARQEAEHILNQAHEEIEQMRADAFDEVQNLKQQAKEEGYQEGYLEGKQQSLSEYEEKMQQLDVQKTEMEQELREKEEELLVKTEGKMVEILCQLVPMMIGENIDNQSNVLLYMINKAMRDLDDSTRFIVRVSEENYPLLIERKADIYGALNPSVQLEIFQDAKLRNMQCLIDTDNGLVDLSLDVQLNNLLKAMRLMSQK